MAKATFEVQLTPSAERDLRRIDRQYYQQLDDALEALALNPRPFQSEALTGTEKGYIRLRTGRFRIVYQIDYGQNMVYVTKLRDRKDVYRRR